MYRTHFNLSRKPFHLGPDINFYYASKTHGHALSYLKRNLGENEGLIVLTGDPGTGKTTLLNQLEETASRQFYVAKINISPKMKSQELVQHVISSLGIKSSPQSSNTELLAEIKESLITQAHQNQHAVIFIDDCHHLSYHSLNELALLAQMHEQGAPLVQCFLTGQSSFRHIMETPEFEQLSQFVVANYHLTSLSEKETGEYISHRLVSAGHKTGDLFTPEASQTISEYTLGVPRRINQACARILRYAAEEGKTSIDEKIVSNIIGDSFTESQIPPEISQYNVESEKKERSSQNRRMHCRRLEDRRVQSTTQNIIDTQYRRGNITARQDEYSSDEDIYPQLEDVVFGIAVQQKGNTDLKEPSKKERPRLANLRFPINEFFRRRNGLKNRSQNPYTTSVLLLVVPIIYFMVSPSESTDPNVIANAQANENSIIDRSEIKTLNENMNNDMFTATKLNNEITDFATFISSETLAFPLDNNVSNQLAFNNTFQKTGEERLAAISSSLDLVDALSAIGIRTNEKRPPIKTTTETTKKVTNKPAAKSKPDTVPKKIAEPKKKKIDQKKQTPTRSEPKNQKTKSPVKVAKAETPPPTVQEPAKLKPENLHIIIKKFTEAYSAGDIEGISLILSDDIKTNDSDDKDTLTSQYKKLFSITDNRDLRFTNILWETAIDEATGNGNFRATILEKGRITPQEYSGTVTIEFKKEDKQIAITDIRYEYD